MVEGQLRGSTQSILTFLTQPEPEYDQDTDLQQRESTHVRWGGQDGRREPDSGLGYTQDYRSRWTHGNRFNPDSVSQRTEQPANHERGAGDRPAEDWIPQETDRHTDSRWDIPQKRPCLRPTEQIVRLSAVTLRRATHTGLRR